MRRTNYGTVGRRPASAAWQWVLIGFILGLACTVTLVLAGMAAGVLTVEGMPGLATATAIVQVITATSEPASNTPPVTEVLVSPTSGQAIVVVPSQTPIPPTKANTATPTATAQVTADAQTLSAGGVPDVLTGIRSELAEIAGGTFDMGTTPSEVVEAVDVCVNVHGKQCELSFGEDSYPVHSVTLNPFQIERTEVTNEQYVIFLNWMRSTNGTNWNHANGCGGQPCIATGAEDETSGILFDSANYDVPDLINRLPVTNVTWYGARAYCEAIGRRLPTEAEWERAARGSAGNIFPWGNELNLDFLYTNVPERDRPGPVDVGTLTLGASPYGVLDMAGNVAEWVNDWYSPTYYSQAEPLNPQGPVVGTDKVVRGGSWDSPPFFARTVHRQNLQPNDQTPWVGFRCAADATAAPASGGGAPTATLSAQDLTEATPDTVAPNNEEPSATPEGTLESGA